MAKKDNNKENKHYFKDFKAEIKKVIWPAPKQLMNTTVAIITMVVVVAVIVFVLDLAFNNMNKYGLTKLQQMVSTSDSTSIESDASDNSTDTATDEELTVEDSTNNDEEVEATESE